jgi:hypothetical protein
MRRRLILFAVVALGLCAGPAPVAAPESLIQIDRRAQIARADLSYTEPASRPEEGMPVGNGRMGSLVWTTPSSLRLQINRADVHAMDSTTFSFGRADSDFGSGCGYVDIHLVDAGDDVFTAPDFRQQLSLYDGLMTARGRGVTARAVAWPNGDVMAIEIDDRRDRPSAVNIDLRMLRYQMQYASGQMDRLRREHSVVFRTGAHTATSTLGIDGNRATLTQQFAEGDFFDSSAVAISVAGRPSRTRYLNESTVQVSAAPGRGRFTILIASAENDQKTSMVAADALSQLDAAARLGFEGLQRETAAWWSGFWAKGAVYLHSASGQADLVDANYNYFLYLMGASSRGDFPPRFGGMLWFTDGDMSRWGSQHWWANTSAYYSNLMPSNRFELIDPMFKLYWGMRDAAALAARQQWGSDGIWFPETTFFNGPERLPDDVAKELQDLVLVRKPWDARSPAFDWFVNNKNRHNSRWNFRADGAWDHGYYVFQNKGSGVFGQTTHIMGVASRVANLAWQRYQLTGDSAWLRDRAYPLIKGAAEFYRNFPNLQKDEAGVYHINHTNSGESAWNSRDAAYEVTCMHMIFPLAARASEVLGVDEALRPAWRDIKAHLVPAPANGLCGTGSEIADRRPYGAFVYNGPGAIEPIGPEPELKQRFLGFTRLGSFIDTTGIGGARIFRNRLRLREGPGAIDAEHIGGLASGIHSTLLNSRPDSTTNDEPISLFNAWPRDWDAGFSLAARGGFVVSSAQQNGRVPLVEIVSQIGGPVRLSNPWGAEPVTLHRNGRKAEDLSGTVLAFGTVRDEVVVVTPRGDVPRVIRMN